MLKSTGFIFVLMLAASAQYQNKRLLLLFADKADNVLLQQQERMLHADPTGLKERDLEIRVYYLDKHAGEFRTKKISAGFTAILIGKDGGEKLRSTSSISLQKLYNTIDAMPMRRQEMKHQPKTE
jgi:hypothetical protein